MLLKYVSMHRNASVKQFLQSPWDTENIARPRIDLSETQPVRLMTQRHTQRTETAFDMHYGLEFGVVLTGRMRRFYRQGRLDLGPGEAWLCGMWEPHGYRILSPPCRVLVLVIWPPMLASLRFEESPNFNWLKPFTVSPDQRPRISCVLRSVLLSQALKAAAIQALDGPSRIELRLLTLEMLLTVCKGWNAPGDNVAIASDDFSRINQVLQHIFDRRGGLTLAQTARTIGLNRNALGSLFKKMMGLGFSDFTLRYRLHGVAGQLRQTIDPVKAIAIDWGFTDASHLHRRFITHYGCSPAEYRKQVSPNNTRK